MLTRSWHLLFRGLAISLIALLLLLPGRYPDVADGAAMHTTDRNTLVIAYYSAPASLDPGVSYDYGGPAVLHGLYEGLVRLVGPNLNKVEPVLATHWTSNAQKTLWTFYLRKGVVFHDGTAFNAAAVKFSMIRMQQVNQSPAYVYGQFVGSKDIEIVDPYTIRLHLHAPAPRLLAAFASQYGTWIVSPTTVVRHRTAADPTAQKWLSFHDAGTGPYALTQYSPNLSATLTKFDRYWRGWAGRHVSRVLFSFVAEDATRRSLIEKGDADLTNNLTPEDLLVLQKNQHLVVDAQSLTGNWTLVPTEHGVFASVQARQALSYAFDYTGFLNGLLKGFGRRARGPLAAYSDGHDPHLFIYPTDLAKARALFAAAGVKPGTKVTMWYPSSDEIQKDVALVIQGQLAALGITVDVQARDAATYSNAYYGSEPDSQRPDLWAGTWSGGSNDAMSWFYPQYHSKNVQTGVGGSNAGDYHNTRADTLMDQANTTIDLTVRQKLLTQIQQILTVEDPAAVYVGDQVNSTVYSKALHGYYYTTPYVFSYDLYNFYKS